MHRRTAASNPPGAEPVSAHEPVGKGKRIVLAEDHDDSRTALAIGLSALGYDVSECRDGAQASVLAGELAPHAVIADLNMPGADGYELAKELRRKHGDAVRLIALTGLAPRQAWLKSMEAGFDYYLVKPVTVEHLIPYLEGDPLPIDDAWKAYSG